MKPKGIVRLFAVPTLVAFLSTQLTPPAYAGMASANVGATPRVRPSLPGSDPTIRVPENLGALEGSFQGKDGRTVILIQDAHSIPDAQRSIQKLIGHFQNHYGVSLVTLEGAASRLDTQFLRSFPDASLLKEAMETYLERGELTGANAAALFLGSDPNTSGVRPQQTRFHGIEDWPLYEEGLGYYLKAVEKEPEILGRLKAEGGKLKAEKEKFYAQVGARRASPLREIDEALEKFYDGKGNWVEAVKALRRAERIGHRAKRKTEIASPPLAVRNDGESPQGVIARSSEGTTKQSQALQALIDRMEHETPVSLEMEVKRVAEKVKKAVGGRQSAGKTTEKGTGNRFGPMPVPFSVKEFNEKQQQFNTSKISAETFALYLKEVIQRDHLPIPTSRLLQQSVHQEQRLRDIQGTELFEEFEEYAESVVEQLISKVGADPRVRPFALDGDLSNGPRDAHGPTHGSAPTARSLHQKTQHLRLLTRLAKLELSRKDWEEVKKWNVGADPRVRPMLGNANGSTHGSTPTIDVDFSNHFEFYRNAEAREEAMFENLMKYVGADPRVRPTLGNANGPTHGSAPTARTTNSAILIAGGFHTEGLTKRLKQAGISYALVMPKIEHIPDQTNYREHMKGNVSWKDYFVVENGRINLYEAFVRGARDRLLGIEGGAALITAEDDNKNQGRAARDKLLGEEGGKQKAEGGLIKGWRDQIILDLAAQNRIGEARRYTKFLDELNPSASRVPPSAFQRQWRANIDRFVQGLFHLESTRQLTEQNILGLFKNATVTSPFASAVFSNSLLDSRLYAVPGRSEMRAPDLHLGGREYFLKKKHPAFDNEIQTAPLSAQDIKPYLEKLGGKIQSMENGEDKFAAEKVLSHLKSFVPEHGEIKIYGFDEVRWPDGSYFFGRAAPDHILLGHGLFEDKDLALQSLFAQGMRSVYLKNGSPSGQDFPLIDRLAEKIFTPEERERAKTAYAGFKDLSADSFLFSAVDRFQHFSPEGKFLKTLDLMEDWLQHSIAGKPHPVVEQAGFLAGRLWARLQFLIDLQNEVHRLSTAGDLENAKAKQQELNQAAFRFVKILYPFFAFAMFRRQFFIRLSGMYGHLWTMQQRRDRERLRRQEPIESLDQQTFDRFLEQGKGISEINPSGVLESIPPEPVSKAAFEELHRRHLRLFKAAFKTPAEWRNRQVSTYGKPDDTVPLEGFASGGLGQQRISNFSSQFSAFHIFDALQLHFDRPQQWPWPMMGYFREIGSQAGARFVITDGVPVGPMIGLPAHTLFYDFSPRTNEIGIELYVSLLWSDLLSLLYRRYEGISALDTNVQQLLSDLLWVRKTLTSSGSGESYFTPDGTDMHVWINDLIDLQKKAELDFWPAIRAAHGSYEEYMNRITAYVQEKAETEAEIPDFARAVWYYTLFARPDSIFPELAKRLNQKGGSGRLTDDAATAVIDTLMAVYWSGPPRSPRELGMLFLMKKFLSFIRIHPDGISIPDLGKFKDFLTGFASPETSSSSSVTWEEVERWWKNEFTAEGRYPEARRDLDERNRLEMQEQNTLILDGDQAQVRTGSEKGFMLPEFIPAAGLLQARHYGSKDGQKKIGVWIGTYQADGLRIPSTDFKYVFPGMMAGTSLLVIVSAERFRIERPRTPTNAAAGAAEFPPLVDIPLADAQALYGRDGSAFGQSWQKIPHLPAFPTADLSNGRVLEEDGFYRATTNGSGLLLLPFRAADQALDFPALKGHSSVLIQRQGNRLIFYEDVSGAYLGSARVSHYGYTLVCETPAVRVLPVLPPSVAHLTPASVEEHKELVALAAVAQPLMEKGVGYARLELYQEPGESLDLDAEKGIVSVSRGLLSRPDRFNEHFKNVFDRKDPARALEAKVEQLNKLWASAAAFDAGTPLPDPLPEFSPETKKNWSHAGREKYESLYRQMIRCRSRFQTARQVDAYRSEHSKELPFGIANFRALVKKALEVSDPSAFTFFFGNGSSSMRGPETPKSLAAESDKKPIVQGAGIVPRRYLDYVFDFPGYPQLGAHFELKTTAPAGFSEESYLFIRYKKTVTGLTPNGSPQTKDIPVLLLFDLKTGAPLSGEEHRLRANLALLKKNKAEMFAMAMGQKTQLDLQVFEEYLNGFLKKFDELGEKAQGDPVTILEKKAKVVGQLNNLLHRALDSKEYAAELNYIVLQLIFAHILPEGIEELTPDVAARRLEEAERRAAALAESFANDPARVLFHLRVYLPEYAKVLDPDFERLQDLPKEPDARERFAGRMESFGQGVLIPSVSLLPVHLKSPDWTQQTSARPPEKDFFEVVLEEAAALKALVEEVLAREPGIAGEDGQWLDRAKAVQNGLLREEKDPDPMKQYAAKRRERMVQYFIRRYFEAEQLKKKADTASRRAEGGPSRITEAQKRLISTSVQDIGGSREGSSMVIRSAGARVVVDTGLDPSYGYEVIKERLHAVVITHYHADHSRSLPEAYERFNRLPGDRPVPCLMTPLTLSWIRRNLLLQISKRYEKYEGKLKSVQAWIARDREKVEKFLDENVVLLDFNVPVRITDSAVLQLIPAGHTEGAASVLLMTENGNTLITSDLSFHDMGPVPGFQDPQVPVHMVIMDTSLAAMDETRPQEAREEIFLNRVRDSLGQKEGKALVSTSESGALHVLSLLRYGLNRSANIYALGEAAGQLQEYRARYPDLFRFHHAGLFPDIKGGVDQEWLRESNAVFLVSSLPSGFRLLNELARFLGKYPPNTLILDYGSLQEHIGEIWRREAVKLEEDGRLVFETAEKEGREGALMYSLQLFGHPIRTEIVDFLGRLKPRYVIAVHGNMGAKQTILREISKRHPDIRTVMPTGRHSIEFAAFVQRNNGHESLDQQGLETQRAWFEDVKSRAVPLEEYLPKKAVRSEARIVWAVEKTLDALTGERVEAAETAQIPKIVIDLGVPRFVRALKAREEAYLENRLRPAAFDDSLVNAGADRIVEGIHSIDRDYWLGYRISEADLIRMNDPSVSIREAIEAAAALSGANEHVGFFFQFPKSVEVRGLEVRKDDPVRIFPVLGGLLVARRNRIAGWNPGQDPDMLLAGARLSSGTARFDSLLDAGGRPLSYLSGTPAKLVVAAAAAQAIRDQVPDAEAAVVQRGNEFFLRNAQVLDALGLALLKLERDAKSAQTRAKSA